MSKVETDMEDASDGRQKQVQQPEQQTIKVYTYTRVSTTM